jgi:hypothetical protein
MNIRILPAALALSAFTFAASAQTGGAMSGPGSTSGSSMMANPAAQGCMSGQNHMSGGAMAGGSGNQMSGSMSGGSMSGGAMSGGSMAPSGAMTGGNHMAANAGCQPAQKPNQ